MDRFLSKVKGCGIVVPSVGRFAASLDLILDFTKIKISDHSSVFVFAFTFASAYFLTLFLLIFMCKNVYVCVHVCVCEY